MRPSRAARAVVAAAAWIVPADRRRDWRREWLAELEWGGRAGRSRGEQWRRLRGAARHAIWLRVNGWRTLMNWQDLRYGARALRARPMLTGVAMLSLALGIGANVAIFTVVNAVLLRPLPFADASRVIQLANGDAAATLSGPEVVDIMRGAKTLSAVGAYGFADGNVTGGRGSAERVRIARVSAGLFSALAPALIAGRGISPDEDRPGAPATVVVGAGLAARYFGDAASAVGRTLLLNDTPRTVIGVAPPDLEYPAANVQVWAPLALDPAAPGERRNHQYRVVGRLAAGATPATAQAEIDAFRHGWETQYPSLYDPKRPLIAEVVTLPQRVLGTSRPYLLAMLGAVALVLLIACVNVASLLLTYGESRRKDLAIAAALGASRGRLAARTLSESVLLAFGGGALGTAIAVPAYRALVALAPPTIPRLSSTTLDPTVLIFAFGISLLTAVASGAMPLVRTVRDCDAAMLRSAGRSGGPAGGRMTQRMHAALVIGEVAVAVTLLGGAGLLTRSLINLQGMDLGFSPSHVLTARVSLPRPAYDDTRGVAAVQAIVDRLGSAPGVRRAAAMAWMPVVEGGGMWSIVGDDASRRAGPDWVPLAAPQQVTPGFFDTLGIRLLRGRDFTTADTNNAEMVAIVNDAFGRMLWRDADPVGHRFRMDGKNARWVTVVGLVADTRVDGITEGKPPVMYFPHAQATEGSYFTALSMTLAVRYSGAAAPLAAEVRRAVKDADPNVPVSDIRGLDEVVGSTIARERFTSAVIGGFAVLAVLLAGIGIYGVIAYGVAQRRFEIGVRMALGAARGRIFADIARRGLLLAAVGLAVGLAGAAAAGRLLRSVLFGVETLDRTVLITVSALIGAVVAAALVAPSMRAMRVNPVDALRPK